MRKHNQGGTATDLAPVMGRGFYILLRIFLSTAPLASPYGRGGRAQRGRRGCKALSVTFGDSSPRGRAKGEGGRCNCAVCHNSIKKRSASARMRSVNCLTNAPLSFRGVFCYPLSSCSYSSCGRRRPTAENDTRAKSSVSRARPRMSSQVTAS